MSVATENEARQTLGPSREAKIYKAFREAWRDLDPERNKYGIWPRTRANMMFERLAIRLQEQFDDDPGVDFSFADETVRVTFDDFLLARCKKADSSGLGHNIPTQANMIFCEAEEEPMLFPGLKKVEIAYVVNKVGTDINDVVVQARDGNMRLWAYAIDDHPAAGAAPVIPFTPRSPTTPPAAPDENDLVRPRTIPAGKRDDQDKK